MGKSVLVTAYTHSAVDNLLFKLEELSVPFLRLGRRESITPSLRKHCVNGSLNSLEELTSIHLPASLSLSLVSFSFSPPLSTLLLSLSLSPYLLLSLFQSLISLSLPLSLSL